MAKANIMGEELQLWVGEGASAHTLGCAMSLSVNITRDSIDVSCKDTAGFAASIAGLINWDISTDCLFVTGDYNELVDAMVKGTPVGVSWATVANFDTAKEAGNFDEQGHIFNSETKAENAGDLYSGVAVITSVNLTADNGSTATYSVTLQGKGAFAKGKK